jgi:hypothetical protein
LSRVNTFNIGAPAREPSYQTAPLIEYSPNLRRRAAEIFELVARRVKGKAVRYKGSFSVLASTAEHTAAKILIVEEGKGKMNGDAPPFPDGVYVLIRTTANPAMRLRTIGVAPKHDERFAYFRVADGQDANELADFIAACCDR